MIDFSEIPTSQNERFVLLCQEFLNRIGLTIEEGPDRGPDGGRDLLAIESRTGMFGNPFRRRWLASVKHFAGGRAVGTDDEHDIIGRLRRFEAHGFLAFYSTQPSSGLGGHFRQIRQQGFLVEVLDAGRLSAYLVEEPRLAGVFQTFLPENYARYQSAWKDLAIRLFDAQVSVNRAIRQLAYSHSGGWAGCSLSPIDPFIRELERIGLLNERLSGRIEDLNELTTPGVGGEAVYEEIVTEAEQISKEIVHEIRKIPIGSLVQPSEDIDAILPSGDARHNDE